MGFVSRKEAWKSKDIRVITPVLPIHNFSVKMAELTLLIDMQLSCKQAIIQRYVRTIIQALSQNIFIPSLLLKILFL